MKKASRSKRRPPMVHNIALNFEDGVTRFITCGPDDTVADAAFRAGINIPLDCRDGACGTCKCHTESRGFDAGTYLEDALTEQEFAQGYALACQMRPRGDLVISVAASSTACRIKSQTITTHLTAVKRLSGSSIAFTLEASSPLAFLPGQYANVTVPGTGQLRSYSFSSAPGGKTVSFLVRDIPQGVMSSFLRHKAVPGTPVALAGPSGSFYLRDIRRPALFLAGGTGLAPFLSMLGKISGTGCDQPIHLIYGVTNDEDLVGVDLLDAFAARIPGFTYACCVAADASAYPRKGHVTAHIEPVHLNGGNVDIYLCGPPPMVEAVRGWLDRQGVTPASFHFEKFAPSGVALRRAA
jgi:benzoate/toluate 1,2-dioxygenase reductase subunit